MNNYHKFIGFYKVNGETKAVCFEKLTRMYKTLITKKGVLKDKKTGEKIETFNGMIWQYVNEDELEVIFND
ncbi:MAG: hypothetical protein ACRDDY_03470 [Clostridium sp.]|uniref:hypothetical protein n=1 Tax=Clostridium sp. TaxID=1506 RepID=UPI003EE72822